MPEYKDGRFYDDFGNVMSRDDLIAMGVKERKCLCRNKFGEFAWNRECPLHGMEIAVDSTSAGRIKDDLENLLNEFHWSATVPKHRIREILNGLA